jgi:FkbM family methyltransferase
LLETSENKSFTKETIEVVRLDNLLGNKKVDFVKMDIEGFEREAIQGMEKILKHVKYMIFEYSPGMKVYNYNILDHLMK